MNSIHRTTRLPLSRFLCALCLSALSALLVCASPARAQDLDALRPIPVLDGGRIKPLDTMARESVRLMTGRESFRGNDPLALTLAIHRDSVSWETRPLIHVPYLSLRTMVGLSGDAQHATPAQVRSSDAYRNLLSVVVVKQRAAQATREDPRLSREETAALELSHRLRMFDAVASGERFAILPYKANASALDHDPWRTVDALAGSADPAGAAVFTAWLNVLRASNKEIPAAPAVDALRLAVTLAAGPNYADTAVLSREVAYHALHPFRLAWIGYLVALAVLCASLMITSPWVYRAGMGLLIGCIAWSIFAFAWRCSITGWAPVTNIYETVIWVALVGAVVAVCIELSHGGKTAAISGAIGATAAGVVADIMPPEFGAAVQNLAPVLRSNLWLTVHVLTITSSYAAFLVALVLGNIVLGLFAWKPSAKPAIALNLKHLYRAVQVGVLLIAAGSILGGLWADVSWGRFWAWDPKEVWALIILLVYLALLHGRFAGWVGQWGLAAGAVVAFLTVLMSWYGVNFILGAGLHSYGFGTGGQLYVGVFTATQLGYIGVCYLAYRAHTHPRTAYTPAIESPAMNPNSLPTAK